MRRFGIFKVAIGAVEVQGPSMEPTFRSGDWLLVRWFSSARISRSRISRSLANQLGSRAKIGDIVLIEREEQPGVIYTKRITKLSSRLSSRLSSQDETSYWVEGDNPAGTDSRSWGWLEQSEIVGKVLVRYKKSKGNKSNS